MEIELYENHNTPVRTPLVNGVLQRDFAEYLIVRYNWPERIRSDMKSIGPKTIYGIATDIRMFLENLAHLNISIEEVTYDTIIDIFEDIGSEWAATTYNIRYTRIRDYFDYLNGKGIYTAAIFPSKRITTRTVDLDDDQYSHTRKSNKKNVVSDSGHKKSIDKIDYRDFVISLETYKKLYKALYEIDQVYAVIAEFMFLTMLRVHNVVQVPLHRSPLNKNWMLWPEFVRTGKKKIKFNCISKGESALSVDIWPAPIEVIYTEYIEPYYEERKEKFDDVYMPRANASMEEYGVMLPEDILWLTKTGCPVKMSMVQKAFRMASKKIGVKVTPHFLRHSGATHLLKNYCDLKGISPDEKQAIIFHNVLKGILGHVSLETTRMYIRTILNIETELYIPQIHGKLRKKVEEDMNDGILEIVEQRTRKYFHDTADSMPVNRKKAS